MSPVEFTEAARQDLTDIHDYIALDSVNAARTWVDHIENICQTLAGMPEMGRNREDLEPTLRSFPVRNYLVFYRPQPNGILIVRILHGARNVERAFDRI